MQHAASLQTTPAVPESTPSPAIVGGPTLPARPTFTPTFTPQPTSTRFFPTSSIRQRMTLPPSWTPTFTPTVTDTRTPTDTPTLTHTPSITPTRSADDLCAAFIASFLFEPDRVYEMTDQVDYLVGVDEPDTRIHLEAVNDASGDTYVITLEGGTFYMGRFGLDVLPSGGRYTWTISLESPRYGNICAVTYRMAVRQPTMLELLVFALSTVQANLQPSPTVMPTPPGAAPTLVPTPELIIPPEIQATLDSFLTPPGD